MQIPTKNLPIWTGLSPVRVGWSIQFLYFKELFDRIHDVPGDVVECGLGWADTFAMLATLAGREGGNRDIWGFDSFRGWPEPSSLDSSSFRKPQAGEWAVPRENFETRLDETGVFARYPELKSHIVPGFFDDTLVQFPADRQIAFLHLDCDLEPSYRVTLAELFPRVSTRGIVCFDEYREFHTIEGTQQEKWPGATRAIGDYFVDRRETIQYHPESGKYFVVKT